jgi:hypothetical protein
LGGVGEVALFEVEAEFVAELVANLGEGFLVIEVGDAGVVALVVEESADFGERGEFEFEAVLDAGLEDFEDAVAARLAVFLEGGDDGDGAFGKDGRDEGESEMVEGAEFSSEERFDGGQGDGGRQGFEFLEVAAEFEGETMVAGEGLAELMECRAGAGEEGEAFFGGGGKGEGGLAGEDGLLFGRREGLEEENQCAADELGVILKCRRQNRGDEFLGNQQVPVEHV